jgi:hypothetical protein
MFSARFSLRQALAAALVLTPGIALADHTGPAGVEGASINVISPNTLPQGSSAVGLRVTYTRPEQRSDAELATLAGQHIHAHNAEYSLNSSLGYAYGLTDRLTVSVQVPYLRRANLREGEHSHVAGQSINSVVDRGSVSGIGDASVLAMYRLTGLPTLTLIGGLKAPTGSTHKRDDDGERFETEHQIGTGSWDPIVGAAFGTLVGPLKLDTSALYQFSGKGAQNTQLGDRAQVGLSLSRRFNSPDEHDAAAEAAPHGHQSWDAFLELSGEWEDRQQVSGQTEKASGGTSVWLSPGVRFNSASGVSVAFAVGAPVQQRIRLSHPDNDYRVTVAVGRAF